MIDLKLNRIDLMAAIDAHNKKCELLGQEEDMIILTTTGSKEENSTIVARYNEMFSDKKYATYRLAREALETLGFGLAYQLGYTGVHPENGAMYSISETTDYRFAITFA